VSRSWLAPALWGGSLLLVFAPPYFLDVATLVLIYLLVLAGLNLIMGYGGQIALSSAAFFGIGAYTSGIVTKSAGGGGWFGLLAAVAVSALTAFAISLPALRLRGHYLAMATLGFNAVASVVFVHATDLTGGPNGLLDVPPIALGGFALDGPRPFYALCWLAVGLATFAIGRLVDSRYGRALRAVGANEDAASATGIDTPRTKTIAFILAAVLAAVAGWLYVHHLGFCSPETFEVSVSILLVVMIAIGGSGNPWGPVFGAIAYVALPEALRSALDLELLAFGACLVLLVQRSPRGVAALLRLR
jgi:branched-chain amino acid transport system permease protein